MDSPAFDLVNSEWWYGRGPEGIEDQLISSGWLAAFVRRWNFEEAGVPTPREHADLAELRALLRGVVTDVAAGKPIRRSDRNALDAIAGAARLHRRLRFAPNELTIELVPDVRDWAWARSEIAASLAELLEQCEWGRIKLCANAECRWVFYDRSKNRRRRWCGASSCGDLDKVRRFRARQRSAT